MNGTRMPPSHVCALQRAVAACRRGCGAAVVAEEKDERVFLLAVGADLREHLADGVVHRGLHCAVGAAPFVLDGAESLEIGRGGFERRMHRIERQVAEPRLALVLCDEVHRVLSECLGGVADVVHRLGALEDGIARVRRGVEVVMRAAEEAEVFVEATLERMERRLVAEVRFAEPPGRVARVMEPIPDGLLRERQAEIFHGRLGGAGIELVPEALLVAARHEARARRRAIRPAHVAAREAHAVLRDGINVRCGNLLREALAAEFAPAEIVGEDDEDVRLRVCVAAKQRCECGGGECADAGGIHGCGYWEKCVLSLTAMRRGNGTRVESR
jgi:hypothetical protein